ncbi:MAG: hypothetical protein Q9M89_03430 [Persephonella sp.]|nr:hypothetical protein [Persephonella sp.]
MKWNQNILVIVAPEIGGQGRRIKFLPKKVLGILVEIEILEVKAEKSKQIEESINQFLDSDIPFSTAENLKSQENSF